MDNDTDKQYSRKIIRQKLREHFDGKIVRKDLTKTIKEGASVPTYVLEFLLGRLCCSDDESIVNDGLKQVKKQLSEYFIRADESSMIISRLRRNKLLKVIDKVSVELNLHNDTYSANFLNLNLNGIPIHESYPEKYERLHGGIWCLIELEYVPDYLPSNYENDDSSAESESENEPKHISLVGDQHIGIVKLVPIQLPEFDLKTIREGRSCFTKQEWIDVIIRSIGIEPDELTERQKWLFLIRMIPLVENNFNFCELGPRETGKSHLYKEISPNSILISGGQTTIANLFYNMRSKSIGLVGRWDCVAFDEVAGIKFKDKDGIQIMKDYMNSGSFARGKEEVIGLASMVFVGNIDQSVDVLMKTSTLFAPFPQEIGTDMAFLDRIHCYLPGWEMPKFRPKHFTDDYGFITDYLAEVMRELRKEQHNDAINQFFKLGNDLGQRDTAAVRKMVGGLIKLVYPNGVYTKDEVEEILKLALEMRRRVKEQLKKLGAMEFFNVNFSYTDKTTNEEKFVSVPEHTSSKLIPEGTSTPGLVYTVERGQNGMIGLFRLEGQMLPGNGKFVNFGIGNNRSAKEATSKAFRYLKANAGSISCAINTEKKDYTVNYKDLQDIGITDKLMISTLISICSIALGRSVLSSLVVLGETDINGSISKVDDLPSALRVCTDSGARRVLVPSNSRSDLSQVPDELMNDLNVIFYKDANSAILKALDLL